MNKEQIETIHGRLVKKVKGSWCLSCCFYSKGMCELTMEEAVAHDCGMGAIFVEIKQNKENMEEKSLNLKPFDLKKAKQGKPVCTRDGRKARIICFDRDWDMHIVALVADPLGESVHYYLSNGKVGFDRQLDDDLMMLPEKKEGWVNVYKDSVYDTKDEALIGRSGNGYIDTIKVSWSE